MTCFKKYSDYTAMRICAAFFAVFISSITLYSTAGFAQTEVNDVVANTTESVEFLPQLISVFTYVLGIMIAITGVLKLKEHAENPTQTPLRTGVIRLLTGGMLFALPMVYEAAMNTIGNDALDLGEGGSFAAELLNVLGGASSLVTLGTSANDLLENIVDNISNIPGLIAVVAYLLGLVLTVIGILKLKDHVENPEQTPLKESIVRLLTGGALFAMPTIYNAMITTVSGDGLGGTSQVLSAIGALHFLTSTYMQTVCDPLASSTVGTIGAVGAIGGALGLNVNVESASFGNLICGVIGQTAMIPALLAAIAYIIGLVFGLWGVLKLRDHVLNPQQTNLYEGISRLLAGGAFFALPFVIEVVRTTMGASSLSEVLFDAGVASLVAGYNEGDLTNCTGGGTTTIGAIGAALGLGGGASTASAAGLDCMLSNFVNDVMGPVHMILSFFSFVAGMALIMIGISRLTKSAQDGARGPGGLGTIMTFVIGGALISYNELMGAMSTTFTGSAMSATYATLSYANGMSAAETASAYAVITAVLKFVIVLGLVSFVRGLFIIRGVAEGNQQASIMAGVTHIIAGTLAVNLGPLINAVQATLGIAEYGIAFGLTS